MNWINGNLDSIREKSGRSRTSCDTFSLLPRSCDPKASRAQPALRIKRYAIMAYEIRWYHDRTLSSFGWESFFIFKEESTWLTLNKMRDWAYWITWCAHMMAQAVEASRIDKRSSGYRTGNQRRFLLYHRFRWCGNQGWGFSVSIEKEMK